METNKEELICQICIDRKVYEILGITPIQFESKEKLHYHKSQFHDHQ